MSNVHIVFPSDNRHQVSPTTIFPYWSIGQLEMTFPNGRQYEGTGTLIDSRYVLTCAHNLWGEELGGPAQSVVYLPARDGNSIPYNFAQADRIFYPEEYVRLSPPNPNVGHGAVRDYTKYLYDYGLVHLTRDVEPGNLMTVYAAPDDALQGQNVNIAGYPGDKPQGTMWDGSAPLPGQLDQHFLFYQISTFEGQSGSAVRFASGRLQNPLWIVGIHVAGSARLDSNFAVRLTDEIIERIQGWMGS